jgi:hypothetical protein
VPLFCRGVVKRLSPRALPMIQTYAKVDPTGFNFLILVRDKR